MNPNRPDVAIAPSYASTNLDHLGLVAGMVDELGLVGKIDALIPQDLGQRQVSLGVAVKAIPAVLQLLVESQAGIPLLMVPLGGNANDQAGFRATVAAHVGQLQADAGLRYLVADSALYNAETLRELGGTVWISRVPETLGAAREILLAVAGDLMQTEEESACRAVGVVYAGIRQRWLVIFSREARQRAEKTLQRQHLRQGEAELKAFDTLCRHGFACEADAQAALDTFAKGLKLTAVAEGRVAAQTRHAKKGRPAKGQEPGVVSYAIQGQLASRLDIHARQLQQKSAFIIATNDINESILSDEQVVEAYKKDQQKVERGFRFLKDPWFMASTLFLKSPKRIMALMAVMTLCLMVYAALEHRIRQGLAEHRQTFPDQQGNPAECPTARWVFQFFTGIHVLLVGQITEVVLNLNTHHQTLLAILGEHYVDLYANSG